MLMILSRIISCVQDAPDNSIEAFIDGTTDVSTVLRALNDKTTNKALTRKLKTAFIYSDARNNYVAFTRDITDLVRTNFDMLE